MPESFGPYRVVRELGRGAFGAVYEVRHPDVDRPLALKVLLGSALDRGAVERFRREAELLARLRHPNVVRVHALERQDAGWVLVSDLIEGPTLEAVLGPGPLPPRRAAQVVHDLAGAVAALHAQGIVHRDLKPENAIVRPDGAPVLFDLGIARDLLAAERLTTTGSLMGTPAYMAPEQVDDSKAAGPQADVYALGAILFALLVGHAPFTGATPLNVVACVLRGPVRWPAQERPDVPPDLDAIVRTAMALAPGARHPSALALADALAAFLAADGASPARARSAVGVVALLGLAAALTIASALAGRPPAPTQGVPPAHSDRPGGVAATSSAHAAAEVSAVAALEELGRTPAPRVPGPVWAAFFRGGLLLVRADGQVTTSPASAGEIGPATERRPADRSVVEAAAWVPDGEEGFVLLGVRDVGLVVLDLEGDELKEAIIPEGRGPLLDELGQVLTVGGARVDGKVTFLAGCTHGLLLARDHGGHQALPRETRVASAQFVNGGAVLLTAEAGASGHSRARGQLVRWRRAGLTVQVHEPAVADLDATPTCMVASPEATSVAVGTSTGRLYVARRGRDDEALPGGPPSATFALAAQEVAHPGGGGVQALAFAGEDRLYSAGASAQGRSELCAWDLRGGALRQVGGRVAVDPVRTIAVSSDRARVLVGTEAGAVVLYRAPSP